MTFRVRRILVAIRDTQRAPRNPLRKAAALAQATGASIELFHAISEPAVLEAIRHADIERSTNEITERVRQRSQRNLERMARSAPLAALRVSSFATWDYPPHEAIIRRVLATRADLVVAATKQVELVFESLAKRAGIPRGRRHLRTGDVPGQLPEVLKRTRAGILVMGALSRSGLRRIFIGSTAETILDSTSCDVFVVKPRGFKSMVNQRRNDWLRN